MTQTNQQLDIARTIHAPLLMAKFDQNLNCIAVSDLWKKKAGVSPEELALDKLFLFNSGQSLSKILKKLLLDGVQISELLVTLAHDKTNHPYHLNVWREISPVDDNQYQISLIVLEQPCLDENLEMQRIRREYRHILGSAGEGIYGLDKEGRTTFANAASTKILGWCDKGIIGKYIHGLHHHTHADGSPYPREDCPIYASLRDGEVHRVDNEVFWKEDGNCIPVEYISTPIIQDGEVHGAVIVFRDITERKKLEQQREKDYREIKRLKEELELERDYLRNEINVTTNFGEIIGNSPALQRTLSQIEAVADTPSSVLILGESGVGKEMIARAIHCQSGRKQAPLVKVNCASIPKDLFESEFFGHIKGAFTGAHRDRVGRLQLANGGTLFLDEVGEIPLELQGKLLRALQEHEFERVGDDRTTKVDVRIVAATNKDLAKEAKAGNFREDLYYRLSVFPVSVPPLRERTTDIAVLAQHFLNISCEELRREPMGISSTQIKTLAAHDWPGNIRELKNVIERAVILSKTPRLRLDLAMPEGILDTNQVDDEMISNNAEFLTDNQFREMEKNNLVKALNFANWKIAGEEGAANLLGLKPSTLTYRMQQFGIKK